MAFAEELRASAGRCDFARLPIVRAIGEGTCPRPIVSAYVAGLAAMATAFPMALTSVMANCDAPAVRRALLPNLLEEEGVVSFARHGSFVLDPAAGHGEMAWRLARATGATEPHPVPRSPWFDAAVRNGRWLGPLAFVSVGFESNVPGVFSRVADGLRSHYGLAEEDLAYLVDHVVADAEHGDEGIEVIAGYAKTADAQAEALEGARRGALAFFQFHKTFHTVGAA